jgi:hypothetical protein
MMSMAWGGMMRRVIASGRKTFQVPGEFYLRKATLREDRFKG